MLPRLESSSKAMARLGRVPWAGGLTFSSYGLRVGVRVSDASDLVRLANLLPVGWEPSATPVVDRLYSVLTRGSGTSGAAAEVDLLYDGGRRLVQAAEPGAVFAALESALQLYVAEHARDRVFVHAGVVGWHD